MSADGVWIAEYPGATDGALPMDKAVSKLRDEITGYAMLAHNGHDRCLSMAMAKLDEARMWVKEYHEQRGTYVTVDKRRFVTDTTEETVSNGHL